MFKMIIAIFVLLAVIAIVLYWARAAARSRELDFENNASGRSHAKRKVRVAFISENAILLCPRDEAAALRGDNLDVPFETVVGRNESVERALARLFAPLYKDTPPDARFCLKHRSRCDDGLCESFLFVVWCGGDDIPKFVDMNYKLWTRRQIETNLGQGLFSVEFEEEYPHLRLVVDTWTMVKEGKI